MRIQGLNTVAIGDLYIPCGVMQEAIRLLKPSSLTTIAWEAADLSDLQARLLRIERYGPQSVLPPDELWQHLQNVEFLMTHLCPISRQLIDAAPNLRFLGLCRGGTDSIDHAALKQRKIQVFSAPGRNANAVAEMTVGLMLAEARNIGRAHASLASGGWRKKYSNDNKPGELQGKTVGLIGFGNIGRRVARLLRGFRVRLIVHDPLVATETIAAEAADKVELTELLHRSDFISLHARRERHDPPLIGAAELKQMKPTAYLVNTARAYLIDEEALLKALQAGELAGAALDVFREEPLPIDSPLRFLDNISLTPHLAGSTLEAWINAPHMVVRSMIEAFK